MQGGTKGRTQHPLRDPVSGRAGSCVAPRCTCRATGTGTYTAHKTMVATPSANATCLTRPFNDVKDPSSIRRRIIDLAPPAFTAPSAPVADARLVDELGSREQPRRGIAKLVPSVRQDVQLVPAGPRTSSGRPVYVSWITYADEAPSRQTLGRVACAAGAGRAMLSRLAAAGFQTRLWPLVPKA